MRLLVRTVTNSLSNELVIPNSKYHAHRALILASLAPGETRIIGLTHAQHVASTLQVLRGLGTKVSVEGDTFVVEGGPYHPAEAALSVGSSGSTLYFMAGLCALADRAVTLVGQRYVQRRPAGPLLQALQRLGVRLTSQAGAPPIQIQSGRPGGGYVRIPGTLSQWVSGLLLLAPFAMKTTTIEVEGPLNERPYIDLTLNMMQQFGLEVRASADRRRFVIPPDQVATPTTVRLPPDLGSAAFGLAITALHPADVVLRGLVEADDPVDHPEASFVNVVRDMGLPIESDPQGRGMRVRHEGVRLQSVHVDCKETPDMLPVLCALATFAHGETVLEHIEHVRLKESDRVAAMLQLNRMGGDLHIDGSRLVIRGVDELRGKDLSSFNDHRVLMSLAIAATRASGSTLLSYPNAYRVSYPEFLQAMNGIGANMECIM